MKYIFPLFLSFLTVTAPAQNIQPFVNTRLENSVLDGAWWGGLAIYTNNPQEEIFSVNPDLRLTPASTLKLLTTAAALETFGPHHRFKTRLYASSLPDEKGILKGDLYLQGGGDPTLGSKRVTGAETWQAVVSKWAKAVKKAGIKQVEGNIYADVSAFEGPSIAPKVNWENIGNYYAAPVSPLCFNDNSFKIFFKPQPLGAKRAEVSYTDPEIAQLKLKSFVTTDAKNKRDNAYVYGAPKQYEMEIYGTIPTNFTGFSIQAAMPDPALFAAQSLHNALREEGIAVGGHAKTLSDAPDYTRMTLLHTYQSPELKDIIVIVNKRSFNLYADTLIRVISAYNEGSGSSGEGVRKVKEFLESLGIDTANFDVFDGSGLARDNIVDCKITVEMLEKVLDKPYGEVFLNSLPVAGDPDDNGTMSRRLRYSTAAFEAFVKTGSLDRVRAVAGYTKDHNGRRIAFCSIVNNYSGRMRGVDEVHDDFIGKLSDIGLNKKPQARRAGK